MAPQDCPTAPTPCDQQIMTDLLRSEKQLASEYSYANIEASCPNMRSMLSQLMQESLQGQYQVFEEMHTRQWYQTQDAATEDVDQAKCRADQLKSQLA